MVVRTVNVRTGIKWPEAAHWTERADGCPAQALSARSKVGAGKFAWVRDPNQYAPVTLSEFSISPPTHPLRKIIALVPFFRR